LKYSNERHNLGARPNFFPSADFWAWRLGCLPWETFLMKSTSVIVRLAFAGGVLVLSSLGSGCDGGGTGDLSSGEQAAPSLRDNLEQTTKAADENAKAPKEEAAKP
jgi:hypothetical protein